MHATQSRGIPRPICRASGYLGGIGCIRIYLLRLLLSEFSFLHRFDVYVLCLILHVRVAAPYVDDSVA